MDLIHVQPGGATVSKEPSRREKDFLQKFEWTVKSAGDKVEDAYLGAEIPKWIRKHLTFYRLHCTYFLLLITLGTTILYCAHTSDKGERRFSIVDSIFNIVSIVTVTGITSVRIADFSLFDRMLLLILMTLGSPVFTSLLPLFVRRFYFFRYHRKYTKEVNAGHASHVQKLELARLNFPSADPGPDREHRLATAQSNYATPASLRDAQSPNRPIFNLLFGAASPDHDSVDQEGSDHDQSQGHRHRVSRRTRSFSLTMDPDSVRDLEFVEAPKSNIIRLSLDGNENYRIMERNDTGCSEDRVINGVLEPWLGVPPSPSNIMKTVEHQGLVALCWLVPTYMVITQLASFVLNLIIFYVNPHAADLLKDMSLNTVLFSFSTTVAAFTNSGVPAHDDNLVPFRKQSFLLLLYTLVSLMGNLLYPPCLRLVIWILHRFASNSRKPVYSYLLNHPRRCFTHLFPSKQTIWLCLTVLGFTAFQLFFFCTLDWHSDALAGLDPVSKVVDGIYQSVSVRNAGGVVVVISELASTMLVLYLFMMFVASYPVTLLRKNSTEYEHAEIGIYDRRWEEELTENSLAFQSRKLLARDSVYLCVILFLLCLIESKNIEDDPLNYSIFNIIFELVSAYGGVGLSVGYSCSLRLDRGDGQPQGPCTDVPYSFSGKWSPTGRIILAVAMFMGRHRGLPDDIDSAIKLPSFSDASVSASGLHTAGSPVAPTAPDRFEQKVLDRALQSGQHQSQSSMTWKQFGSG